jgi:hypothetical protein
VEEHERVGLHHRVGLFAVAALMLVLVALLPIVINSSFQTLLHPTVGQVFPVATPAAPSPVEYADLRLALVGMDELSGFMTLRVTGYYTCLPPCSSSARIVFASLDPTEAEADRLPRSAAVLLSASSPEVSQTLQLPVPGHALQYPFDQYELTLGVSLQRVGTDGTLQPLTAAEAANHLRLTLREALPNFQMSVPVAIDPTTIRTPGLLYDYLYVVRMALGRPLDLQATAVVLMLLMTMVVAFAVATKPLSELLVGAGGMILALWGMRGLLVPSNITYITLVDVCLGLVMGILLAAINGRGLVWLVHRNRLRVPGKPSARAAHAGERPFGAARASHAASTDDEPPSP